ncbi:tetratricopeptide repeat protein [Chitinophaga sedimenti]|uniref:tetratricopeptide repeat protein n=1 Tax=Chitinophaga sedimenti TaxID=2033606 RepID=UPI002006442E|nr:tetratricopeptide repeat protein [Chitinophaga sedimenti]MCK7553753.1 tetratricopeptide repeat protein [Chitinophaga sedimenti]
MQLHPQHPGAHHFYIHALEASATPEKALASSYVLDTLVPGAGHLLHMPSHIYINTGDYHLGSISNVRAVAADSVYTTACHAQGAYPLAYYPHNYHFLVATATLEGNTALAWQAAMKLHQHTSKDIMRQPGWGTLQHYYSIPYYVAVKLNMWDTILALPSPAPDLIYPRAIWHYARGMAFLGKHDMPNARRSLDSLQLLAADTTLQDITIWNINTTYDLVQIAAKVLSAGVASPPETAISLLKEAVALEDQLNYNEPPDWFFSVRHHLGAVLLKAAQYKEAEAVYREDLRTWRKNGWALIGLQQALSKQNKEEEARQTLVLFKEAWKYADITLGGSSVIGD